MQPPAQSAAHSTNSKNQSQLPLIELEKISRLFIPLWSDTAQAILFEIPHRFPQPFPQSNLRLPPQHILRSTNIRPPNLRIIHEQIFKNDSRTITLHRDILPTQSLVNEIRNHPIIASTHARPIGVEYAHDPRVNIVVPLFEQEVTKVWTSESCAACYYCFHDVKLKQTYLTLIIQIQKLPGFWTRKLHQKRHTNHAYKRCLRKCIQRHGSFS